MAKCSAVISAWKSFDLNAVQVGFIKLRIFKIILEFTGLFRLRLQFSPAVLAFQEPEKKSLCLRGIFISFENGGRFSFQGPENFSVDVFLKWKWSTMNNISVPRNKAKMAIFFYFESDHFFPYEFHALEFPVKWIYFGTLPVETIDWEVFIPHPLSWREILFFKRVRHFSGKMRIFVQLLFFFTEIKAKTIAMMNGEIVNGISTWFLVPLTQPLGLLIEYR